LIGRRVDGEFLVARAPRLLLVVQGMPDPCWAGVLDEETKGGMELLHHIGTMHLNRPDGTVEQIALLRAQSPETLDRTDKTGHFDREVSQT